VSYRSRRSKGDALEVIDIRRGSCDRGAVVVSYHPNPLLHSSVALRCVALRCERCCATLPAERSLSRLEVAGGTNVGPGARLA
jgi:hypothetical protein